MKDNDEKNVKYLNDFHLCIWRNVIDNGFKNVFYLLLNHH